MHHEFWLVTVVNRLLGGTVASIAHALGFTLDPAHAIPPHIVMSVLVVLIITALALAVKSQLSVENPGKMQILLEDFVSGILGILGEYIGPKGARYLPLIGAVGLFIFVANAIGKIPGLMSPTANINVPAGCAVTVWVFYHLMGFREQGVVSYLKHFAVMPGAPIWTAPLVLVIELISHMSRVLSLTLRLFGNVYGEEMVVGIIAMHRAARRAAPVHGARRHHRQPAGVHLRDADHHLPRRRGPHRPRARGARARGRGARRRLAVRRRIAARSRIRPAGTTRLASPPRPQASGCGARSPRPRRPGDGRTRRIALKETDVKKTFLTVFMVLAAGFLAPAYAQDAAAAAGATTVAQWSIITAGFALAFAAAFGALGQGKAVSAAVEGIARNPGAAGDIRGSLILGLVLIESLVIYVLVIALLLFFQNPFRG